MLTSQLAQTPSFSDLRAASTQSSELPAHRRDLRFQVAGRTGGLPELSAAASHSEDIGEKGLRRMSLEERTCVKQLFQWLVLPEGALLGAGTSSHAVNLLMSCSSNLCVRNFIAYLKTRTPWIISRAGFALSLQCNSQRAMHRQCSCRCGCSAQGDASADTESHREEVCSG